MITRRLRLWQSFARARFQMQNWNFRDAAGLAAFVRSSPKLANHVIFRYIARVHFDPESHLFTLREVNRAEQ